MRVFIQMSDGFQKGWSALNVRSCMFGEKLPHAPFDAVAMGATPPRCCRVRRRRLERLWSVDSALLRLRDGCFMRERVAPPLCATLRVAWRRVRWRRRVSGRDPPITKIRQGRNCRSFYMISTENISAHLHVNIYLSRTSISMRSSTSRAQRPSQH